MKHQWHIYSDFEKSSEAAAEFIADKIRHAVKQNNVCYISLPGGNTPAKCLNALSKKNLNWEKIHWYLSDERCYPIGHKERNDVMLEKNLWSKLPVANKYPIPAELGPDEAACEYQSLISQVPFFDIAFLGMGEDGHTASLFPNNPTLEKQDMVVAVYNSPKPPSERVSLSMITLRNAHCRIVLASGIEKAEIIQSIKVNAPVPINCIGDIDWFIDKTAADG